MKDDPITEAIYSTASDLLSQGHSHADIASSLIHQACAGFVSFMMGEGYCSRSEGADIARRIDAAVIAAFNEAADEELAKVGQRN